jgi:hypothetical protein
MNQHSLTVTFEDEELTVEEIITVLGGAGYTVPSHSRTEP